MSTQDLNDSPGTVQVAFIYRDEVSYSWHESMWETSAYDRTHGWHLRRRLADLDSRLRAGWE
jgi:hypothetical protein